MLKHFSLYEERIRDIVLLLKFAFENIDSEEFEIIQDIGFEGMKDIRKLVRDYTLWNLEILMRDIDFQLLLNKMPCLEKDLFRGMWK